MPPKPPQFPEVEAAIRDVAIKVGEELRDLEGRLPNELKPTVAQLESLIRDVIASIDVAALRDRLFSDVRSLFLTGKGEVKHSPSDLA